MKFKFFSTLLLQLLVCICLYAQQDINRYALEGRAQGTTWSIIYFSKDSTISKSSIDSILFILDNSLSIYRDSSIISAFNRSESGLAIDTHLFKVVHKSLEICRKTQGRFDITVKPLVELWGFAARQPNHLPDSQEITSVMPCIGSKNLQLEPGFLRKSRPCTQIDVNGIAQGYSVDVLASYMESIGIQNYLVEVGGEIRAKGRKGGGDLMRVGIESPVDDFMEPAMMQRIVELSEGALTTSGSYRKYYESQGKKISHIIDPFTGYSSVTDLISVSVYARDAITADGFDNAILMMGLQKGLKFVEKHKELAAFFIYKDKTGHLQSVASSRFKRLLVKDGL